MSLRSRSLRRSAVVASLTAAALLAACAGSPTEPTSTARSLRPSLDSLPIRVDPRLYDNTHGLDLFETDAVRPDRTDDRMLARPVADE